MSLIANLTNTARTLNAHSSGVETAGKNLANANNPAYARQRVEFADRGSAASSLGPQSLGLEAVGLRQVRDQFLDAQIAREASRHEALEAQQLGWRLLQTAVGHELNTAGAVGEPGLAAGLAESVDAFFNAFQGLAASPNSSAEKQAVIQEARQLVERIHKLDSQLQGVEEGIRGRMASGVDSANGHLERIAELNREIERFEVHRAGAAVDLRDRRQELIEELSGQVQVEVRPAGVGQGRVDIFVLDANDQPVPLIDGGELQNRLELDGDTLAAGGAEVVLRGGALLGYQRAGQEGARGIREDLAAFTGQLVVSVNEAYAGSGRVFFDPGGITPAGIQTGETFAGLRAAPAGSDGGSNEVALAVAALGGHSFSLADGDAIDGRLGGAIADIVAGTGQALRRTSAALDDQQVVSRLLTSQRESYSGVSLDEEMADLMKFQRAFQASARVMNTVDSMLELIVTRLGR